MGPPIPDLGALNDLHLAANLINAAAGVTSNGFLAQLDQDLWSSSESSDDDDELEFVTRYVRRQR